MIYSRLRHMRHAIAYRPLHTPNTWETCKKSTPCLIKKASRCVIDCMSKAKNVFYLSLSIKHKDLTRKSCVFICYFIGSVMKIVLHKAKDDRLWQNKKKHIWWNNCFSDIFTYHINRKHFALLLSDTRHISCFK